MYNVAWNVRMSFATRRRSFGLLRRRYTRQKLQLPILHLNRGKKGEIIDQVTIAKTYQFRIRWQAREEIGDFVIVDVAFRFSKSFSKLIDNKRENKISKWNIVEYHGNERQDNNQKDRQPRNSEIEETIEERRGQLLDRGRSVHLLLDSFQR